MATGKIPDSLSPHEFQARMASVRKRLLDTGNDALVKALDGHERICNCADCAEVRDAAFRQFEQLMEHQCLYYVIQVAAALDAICKVASLRWVSPNPDVSLADSVAVASVVEHKEIARETQTYMAHADTVEAMWPAVSRVLIKHAEARRK